MSKEVWRKIPFATGYEVSSKGRVRSRKTGKYKFLKPEAVGRRDRKTTYLRVTLYVGKNRRRKHRKIHRLVALMFKERPPGKDTVNHINGNAHDNREENLEWTTNEENIKHAWDTGLMPYARKKDKDGVRRKQGRKNSRPRSAGSGE